MAILDLSNAISPKQCKIGAKLVLITNRNAYKLSIVPNSVTLDDREAISDFLYKVLHREPGDQSQRRKVRRWRWVNPTPSLRAAASDVAATAL